jgi:hypothetical protein
MIGHVKTGSFTKGRKRERKKAHNDIEIIHH